MPLIKDGRITDDCWRVISEDDAPPSLTETNLILPLAMWQARSGDFDSASVGVWIEGDTDLAPIGAAIARAPVIAVRFPGFMDGRGFSAGRLLRERYHFTGELRAIGHFIRDQLCYLRRCGFSAFQFPEGENLEAALDSLNDFQEYYQAAVDEPLPLFRRRRA